MSKLLIKIACLAYVACQLARVAWIVLLFDVDERTRASFELWDLLRGVCATDVASRQCDVVAHDVRLGRTLTAFKLAAQTVSPCLAQCPDVAGAAASLGMVTTLVWLGVKIMRPF